MNRFRAGSIAALGLALLATACGSSDNASTSATSSGGASGGAGPGSGGSSSATGGHHDSGGGGASSSSVGGAGGSGGDVGPLSEIHLIGRMDQSDSAGPRFGWPGSAIVTRFSGTDLHVKLLDNVWHEDDNYFEVVVDHLPPTTIHVPYNGSTDFTIASGLADGEHDVWIEKRTESDLGAVQFLGLTTNDGGHLVATPEPFARKIEFVGDSITCGYGIEGTDPCGFTPATESEYLAWGAVAARALKAEHFTIAYSGIGVYRGSDHTTTDQMPVRYERTVATVAGSTWDFSWVPDVVVVNLGTNDFNGGDPGQPYIDAYVAFAAQIRGHYPDALIICAVGPVLENQNYASALQDAKKVVAKRAAANDTNMDWLDLGVQGPNHGCQGHPNKETDQAMADKLVAKVQALKGW